LPALTAAFFIASYAFPLAPARVLAQKGKFKGGEGGGANGVIIKSDPRFLTIFKDVVAGASQSVVRVRCDGKDVALGVIVASDGFVLTKYSDLTDKISVKTREGKVHEAKLVGFQQQHDLAMLKIDADGLLPVVWTDSKAAPAGHLIASPGMATEPVAVGVVSVPTRTLPAGKGFAAPPAPNPNSGFLGISLEDGLPSGARVSDVQAKSAAEKAGIKVNDLIVAVAGKGVEDASALIQVIQGYKAGETVDLKVKRGSEELALKATLGKRPANQSNRGDMQNNMGSELSKRRTGFPTILQTDQVIKPNDCGGPLVDLSGQVIGINIARAGRVESYAIPSEVIQPLLRDLMSGKLAPPGAKKENESEKK